MSVYVCARNEYNCYCHITVAEYSIIGIWSGETFYCFSLFFRLFIINKTIGGALFFVTNGRQCILTSAVFVEAKVETKSKIYICDGILGQTRDLKSMYKSSRP